MRRLWPWLSLLGATGCLEEPPFRCQSDEVCFLQGYPGTCDLPTATCVYPSADCRGINSSEGFVDGAGKCVPAPNSNVGPAPTTASPTTGDGDGSAETTDPGSSDSANTSPTTDDSATTSTPVGGETSSTGADDDESSSGASTTAGQGCGGVMENITDQGTVTATSVFDGYPVSFSVDGAANTSWFSTGPEGGGGPSVYGWNTVTDRCINRVEVDDNSGHSNQEFRTGYGFGSVVIRVLQDELVVFEETVQLPGTPDGPFAVDTGGVLGSRVLLVLSAHENESCGGFSELRVFGG